MTRPTKILANAGADPLEYAYTVDGTARTVTVPAGGEVVIPLDDAELAILAEPPTPPTPLLSLAEQVGAALATIDPATATVADVLAALDPIFPKP